MARTPTFALREEAASVALGMPPERKRSEKLAALMRHYREKAGLTQTDVERATGVRRDYLSSIELGRIAVVYPETFNRLRRAYGFPGFEMLETMGYETDAAVEGVDPSVIALCRTMTLEQQRALAALAKATMKLSDD